MKNRKTAFFIIAIILFGIMAMISCTNKKGSDVVAPEVSFSHDVIPILQADCAISGSCHSGSKNTGDNIDFDSSAAYNTIISKDLILYSNLTGSMLYEEISSGQMPLAPYNNIPAANKSLILNWIIQGAKDN